jgi:hypothetical protein
MKVYRSKISGWIIIPVMAILTIVTILSAYNRVWFTLAFLIPISAFVTYTIFSIYYTIDGEKLIIKCGFLYNISIEINSIKKITETNNPISSPASSLDRIELVFNKRDRVMISPKHKLEFIEDLKQINNTIEVKLRSENSI